MQIKIMQYSLSSCIIQDKMGNLMAKLNTIRMLANITFENECILLLVLIDFCASFGHER